MNRELLKQALDALIDSVDDSRAVLAQHLENYGEHYRTERAQVMRQTVTDVEAAIAALEAELAKPEGCLSNCDTCTYAWGSPANPGHCSMFFEEPQGVCPKHSEPHQTRNCSRHPAAPHGFDRNGSHAAGRYMCECESWEPGEAS